MLVGRGARASKSTPCLYTISLIVDGVIPDGWQAAWDWTKQRFDTCAILVGDSMHRLSLEIRLGLDAAGAEERAAQQAARLVDTISVCLEPQTELVRTSMLCRSPDYLASLDRLAKAYRDHPDLRRAVDDDATRFCDRQHRRARLGINFAAAHQIAVRYLLEEVSVYAQLAEAGWLAETYLGSEVGVLSSFIQGRIRGLFPALEQRTHLSLRVTGRAAA